MIGNLWWLRCIFLFLLIVIINYTNFTTLIIVRIYIMCLLRNWKGSVRAYKRNLITIIQNQHLRRMPLGFDSSINCTPGCTL